MGIFNLLFGSDHASENVATSAGLGAIVGNELDKARDRRRMIDILMFQAEQTQNQNHLQNSEQARRELNELSKEDAKHPWPWRMGHECMPLHNYCMQRHVDDKQYRAILSKLSHRWKSLAIRALKVGVMPLSYMPRSVSGDVVGIPQHIELSLDKLEKHISIREKAAMISRRYNGT